MGAQVSITIYQSAIFIAPNISLKLTLFLMFPDWYKTYWMKESWLSDQMLKTDFLI